jgi:hypothetical protein
MIRGVRPLWRLHDAPGPEWPGQFTERTPLETFYGDYTDAMVQAEAWCDEHGYYLSSYSDADDREDSDA